MAYTLLDHKSRMTHWGSTCVLIPFLAANGKVSRFVKAFQLRGFLATNHIFRSGTHPLKKPSYWFSACWAGRLCENCNLRKCDNFCMVNSTKWVVEQRFQICPCLHLQSAIWFKRISLSIHKHLLPTWYLHRTIFGNQTCWTWLWTNSITSPGNSTGPPLRWCDQATPHVPAAPLAHWLHFLRHGVKRGRDVAYSHAEWVYIKWKSCSLNMKLTIHQFDQCLIMQNLRHQEISWNITLDISKQHPTWTCGLKIQSSQWQREHGLLCCCHERFSFTTLSLQPAPWETTSPQCRPKNTRHNKRYQVHPSPSSW